MRALDRVLDAATPGAAAALPRRADVSIEVLLDEIGHVRAVGADDEIIERAVLLGQITAAPATLVTADTGITRPRRGTGRAQAPSELRQGQGVPVW